jgi:hypothetical protein
MTVFKLTSTDLDVCPLCNRPLGFTNVDDHHLIPRTFKGRETVTLHRICHRACHAYITEREMVKYYHTIERLLEHEDVQTFVRWVQNKDIEFYSSVKESTSRKGKRRR